MVLQIYKIFNDFNFYCTLPPINSLYMKFNITLLIVCSLLSCSNNSVDKNCKFLLDVNVNATINLNLPEYSQLQFAGNSVYIPNYGNKGIIIASTGVSFYAWDAADPNHSPSDCSVLKNTGLEATCGCDDGYTYSLVTGQVLNEANLPCGLKFYAITQSGNTLYISN